MKSPVIKRLLPFALALCLTCGSSLSAYAAEAKDAEAQISEESTASENTQESTGTKSTEETAAQNTAASGKTGTTGGTTTGGTTTGGTTSGGTTTEKPNTDIVVTPSNANALLLMDAGAQSPKAVPGQEVEVVLTLAVNREYLPSEKYILRNITIQPNIPKDSTKDSWPFDIVDASKVRHLDDMSYNSTAEVWYKFSVSQFAKEGVYPINFTVNATVWREDSVNGTAITEDVTFNLNVFLTVTENGDMSGVVSNIGPLNVAGRENTAIASPTGSPGETVVMSMPIVNKELIPTGDNIYQSEMERLRDNIIRRYETSASDDWEWMNLGFAKGGIVSNASPDALPANFDLHARLRKLDTSSSVAMTDFDRTIMMLTAMGINASKLDQYTTPDNPFKDAKGNVITDLTACLYNYSGGYTINGPIFALIALDMGEYTIPKNAVWTREKLLETILDHKYGSDGFGVDMVGMLMQSIAPYQDDPVYGERVKAKLEEGIGLFLGEGKASTVDPMQPDFTFGGFGYQSSESAAQAICALSAAGVDCHTDPRFSDGKGNSALTAFLAYADGEYFAHTMSVPKNAMATYQGCYTVQWYLGFLQNGGAGHPYSLYYHQQKFSRPLSTEADIKSFVLEGQEGVIEGNQITVTLPTGTPLKNMTPELTLSDYATLESPSLPLTFSANVPVTFTVLAEDGETRKSYFVTIQFSDELQAAGTNLDADSLELQDANILRDVEITSRKVTEKNTATDILLSVGPGVDTENLYIKGTISYGAVTEPEEILNGKTKVNLSGWTTVLVKAQDGEHVKKYRIKVEAQESAAIESFAVTIDDVVYRGVIDDEAGTIQVLGVPSDADVTSLAPEIVVSEGTNVCSPLSGVPQNFSSTVTYTVSGKGLATRVYSVDILDADGKRPTGKNDTPDTPSTPDTPVVASAKITEFSILGVKAVIDDEAGTILLTLPAGTDVSHVVSQVTVGNGCTVSPAPGEVVDLRNPVVYTVTNGSETSYYTVIVTLEKTHSQQLWEQMEEDNTVTDHQVVRD